MWASAHPPDDDSDDVEFQIPQLVALPHNRFNYSTSITIITCCDQRPQLNDIIGCFFVAIDTNINLYREVIWLADRFIFGDFRF